MNSAEHGMWSAVFWKAAGERALRTFAQTLAALLVADATGLLDAAWVPSLSASGMAALVSLLTSIGVDAYTGSGPSITSAEVLEPYDAKHDKES